MVRVQPGGTDDAAVAAIISTIVRHLQREHPRPTCKEPALRDAHPKHHACVRASFEIEPDLPNELSQGLFATPGKYQAWVRFSNAFKVRHDLDRDARGMAIKVMGVSGSEVGTQDFLLVTHKVFFAKDPSDFVDFPAAVAGTRSSMELTSRVFGFFFGLKPFRFKWSGHWALQRSLNWTTNPLVRTYFSQTPYRFGHSTAKFRARPQQRGKPQQWIQLWLRLLVYLPLSSLLRLEFRNWRNVLQQALLRHLQSQPAVFDFEVQLRRDGMPLNNALKVWSESQSNYRKVATIRIDPLDFDPRDEDRVKTMMKFGQHLSYTPWHAMPEHEPLGSINLARRAVYESVSRLRHGLNRVALREPRPNESHEDYLQSIKFQHRTSPDE